MCDILIVGVCDDTYVKEIKKKEPVINEKDRLRIIKALKLVDDAFLVDIETTNDKMKAWERIKFDVLFSDDDWKESERYLKTEEDIKPLGVSIEYLPYTKEVSTTMLKEKMKNNK